jgi:hypothetical protein
VTGGEEGGVIVTEERFIQYLGNAREPSGDWASGIMGYLTRGPKYFLVSIPPNITEPTDN